MKALTFATGTWLLLAAACLQAQPQWRLLENFESYRSGEALRGQGNDQEWRIRGWAAEHAGQVAAHENGKALSLLARQIAFYDNPNSFAVEKAAKGTLHLRLRLPSAENIENGQAFFLILKTRDQADSDLTRPNNGVLTVQFRYAKASHDYRVHVEGPGPSPTEIRVPAEVWCHVLLLVDHTTQSYRLQLGLDAKDLRPITNHRYRDGVIPFQNTTPHPVEIIYLRNHSINGPVLVDDLHFSPSEQSLALPPLR